MEDGELSETLNGLSVMLVLSADSYNMLQEVVCATIDFHAKIIPQKVLSKVVN